jgi:Tol biopolymer transport system component
MAGGRVLRLMALCRGGIAGSISFAVGLLLAIFAATASATFPGANGRIAYGTVDLGSQRQSIHTVLPDGSGDQILTAGGGPAWSPSGGRIAFTRPTAESLKAGVPPLAVFMAGLHGGSPRYVTNVPTTSRALSFSPSGARIASAHDDAGGEPHVFTIRTDGSDERRIASGRSPVYSPAERLIAYIGKTGYGFWTMRADGTHKRRIVDAFRFVAPVDFSPDGRTILFYRATGERSIPYTVSVAGGPVERLGPCVGYGARFSPDGKMIVSIHPHHAPDRYFETVDVTPADGSCPSRTVVRSSSGFNGVAWQPRPGG